MPVKNAWTNRADPDQTASEEAVWSGSSLFAILTSNLWCHHSIEKIVRNFRTFTLVTTSLQSVFDIASSSLILYSAIDKTFIAVC